MGLFGKSISNDEIDQVVMAHISKYLGAPQDFGKHGFDEKYDSMLESLREWSDTHKLGNWKKSSVVGSLEASIRRTLKGHIASDFIGIYIKKARYKILDCTL